MVVSRTSYVSNLYYTSCARVGVELYVHMLNVHGARFMTVKK